MIQVEAMLCGLPVVASDLPGSPGAGAAKRNGRDRPRRQPRGPGASNHPRSSRRPSGIESPAKPIARPSRSRRRFPPTRPPTRGLSRRVRETRALLRRDPAPAPGRAALASRHHALDRGPHPRGRSLSSTDARRRHRRRPFRLGPFSRRRRRRHRSWLSGNRRGPQRAACTGSSSTGPRSRSRSDPLRSRRSSPTACSSTSRISTRRSRKSLESSSPEASSHAPSSLTDSASSSFRGNPGSGGDSAECAIATSRGSIARHATFTSSLRRSGAGASRKRGSRSSAGATTRRSRRAGPRIRATTGVCRCSSFAS